MSSLITVTANFTAEPLGEVLRFWSDKAGLADVRVQFSGYNQVFQELMAPSSALASAERGVNLLLIRPEEWGREHPEPDRPDKIRRAASELVGALRSFVQRSRRPTLLYLAPVSHAAFARDQLKNAVAEALAEIEAGAHSLPGIEIIDAEWVGALYPVKIVDDAEANEQAHIPFTQDYWVALGTALLRRARVYLVPPSKVIAVDADNTLWGGVLAEVGWQNVELGAPWSGIQRFLRSKVQNGMLLVLVSKNREEDVVQVFQRPEMVLQRDDFVALRVNWIPKSRNIVDVAEQLNLGLDSFIFLDDNPVECAEVAAHSGVTVLQLPAEHPEELLKHAWVLDVQPPTAGDAGRTEKYRQQEERKQFRSSVQSFGEFIESLGLVVEFRVPRNAEIDRAAQLTQRTNQFNATGVRRTASELKTLTESGQRQAVSVRVRDRFGDYGDVGLCVFSSAGGELRVENFLLSCRAIGRGVEHRMLAHLGQYALGQGLSHVVLPLIRTERNEPVVRFLESTVQEFFQVDGYRIPAEAIAGMVFRPEDQEEIEVNEERPVSPKPPPGRRGFETRSAQLATVEQIRAAIRDWASRARPVLPTAYRAPSSNVEQTLAGIWCDALALNEVGVDDNFFDLGGDSVKAVQVISRASAAGMRLTLKQFLQAPTISELRPTQSASASAEVHPEFALAGGVRMEDILALSAVSKAPGGRVVNPSLPVAVYPLSSLQQGMLFHGLEAPHSGVGFEQDVFRIHGQINPADFEQAWGRAIARHGALRTTFLWENIQVPHQVVHRECAVPIRKEDWRSVTAVEQEARLKAYLASERQQGFDLTKLPLMRLALLQMAEQEWIFVWNYHHIILDGWSTSLVLRDVFAAYRGEQTDSEPQSHQSFVAWLAKQDPAKTQAFWKHQLAGFTAKTPLAVDQRVARSVEVTHDTYATQSLLLPAAESAEFAEFARRHRVTLGTVIEAAWGLLLSRYSNNEDVVFGCTLAGRSPLLAGSESIVGLLINTLPVRIRASAGTPLMPWLNSVQNQVAELTEFDHSALMQVQKWSEVPAGQSLFDSIVVVENSPAVGQELIPGVRIEFDLANKHTLTGYPLTLVAWPGATMRFDLKYDQRRLNEGAAKRLLGHLRTLLRSMVSNPAGNLEDLQLLPESELSEVLGYASSMAPEPPEKWGEGSTLHRLFEQQVERTPDAVALTCGETTVTYRELNAQANKIARKLRGLGVQRDTLVGLCLDRTPRLVVGLIAILKAGGAYLPIDPSYPKDRVAFMLEDAQAPVLLTERTLVSELPSRQATVLLIEEVLADTASATDGNLDEGAGPGDLAYVIYTSGTTGKPKGSLITHANVVRLFSSTVHWFGFGPQDVWTLFHSAAFDFSVWEIWGALLYGGRLVVVPFVVSRSPEEFYQLLATEQVTVLNQTPSAFRQLIQAEESVGQKPLSLRYVVFGGEALEMQSLRPWFERHGDRVPQLINMYGITETTVHVTYRALSQQDVTAGSVIGRAIPDLRVYILDPQRRPVPIGIAGELYVGGSGVARGYLRRPDLTDEKFVPNPFDPTGGSKLYRTGDLGRFLPGGDIEYLGRIDQQVKIRGFRIELGEIESVLLEHPAIREAVVIALDDVRGAKSLAGYLVAGVESRPDPLALKEHLRRKLPDYMVPPSFVFLERLPLTNNGKVDFRMLPKPQKAAPVSRGRSLRTKTESEIEKVWKKVFGIEAVDPDANFFDLGGDSVLLIQVHNQLRKTLGVQFPVAILFEHPTIQSLAGYFEGSENGGADAAALLQEKTRKQREALLRMRTAEPAGAGLRRRS